MQQTKRKGIATKEKKVINRTKEIEGLKVYSLSEIEPIVGVSHRTLLSYVKSGKLKCVKVGGKWKISEENLKKFINGES